MQQQQQIPEHFFYQLPLEDETNNNNNNNKNASSSSQQYMIVTVDMNNHHHHNIINNNNNNTRLQLVHKQQRLQFMYLNSLAKSENSEFCELGIGNSQWSGYFAKMILARITTVSRNDENHENEPDMYTRPIGYFTFSLLPLSTTTTSAFTNLKNSKSKNKKKNNSSSILVPHLRQIFIIKSERRRGHASALVSYFMSEMKCIEPLVVVDHEEEEEEEQQIANSDSESEEEDVVSEREEEEEESEVEDECDQEEEEENNNDSDDDEESKDDEEEVESEQEAEEEVEEEDEGEMNVDGEETNDDDGDDENESDNDDNGRDEDNDEDDGNASDKSNCMSDTSEENDCEARLDCHFIEKPNQKMCELLYQLGYCYRWETRLIVNHSDNDQISSREEQIAALLETKVQSMKLEQKQAASFVIRRAEKQLVLKLNNKGRQADQSKEEATPAMQMNQNIVVYYPIRSLYFDMPKQNAASNTRKRKANCNLQANNNKKAKS